MWNALNQNQGDIKSYDDQLKLNYALDSCNIKWFNRSSSETVSGQCDEDKLGGLRVTVLSRSLVCRRCSDKYESSVYVWHGRARKAGDLKMKVAVSAHTWLLKELNMTQDGRVIDSKETENLKGVDWLRAISLL